MNYLELYKKDILVCPCCRKKLKLDDAIFYCEFCRERYDIKENIPILISSKRKKELNDSIKPDITWKKTRLETNKFINFIKKLVSPPGNTIRLSSDKYLKKIKANKDDIILDLGAGRRKINENVISYDIFIAKNISICGVGEELPFVDDSIDIIICTTVLEHVRNYIDTVNEAVRVLKPGGKIYLTVPFSYIYHPGDNTSQDFYRFSHIALKLIHSELEVNFIEVEVGPFGGITGFLQRSVALLIPYSNKNQHIYRIANFIFQWLFSWLKYLDLLVKTHPLVFPVASCFAIEYKKKIKSTKLNLKYNESI